MKRPAESAGALGAVATAVAYAAGAPPDVVAAIGVASGAVPMAVTLLVDHGGVRGVARLLWRGR